VPCGSRSQCEQEERKCDFHMHVASRSLLQLGPILLPRYIPTLKEILLWPISGYKHPTFGALVIRNLITTTHKHA